MQGVIGEGEPYVPPVDLPDHWGLTESSLERQLNNMKNLGKNELRTEQRKKLSDAISLIRGGYERTL
jgi:hypothetical protein